MAKIFTIDWECWDSFRPHTKWKNVDLIEEPTMYLLDLLRRHQIKAIWYVVGWLCDQRPDLFNLIKINGHVIGDHTYYHAPYHNEVREYPLYRGPRWQGEKRLFSGGFWFRTMPYWWIKREVEQTGIFFIHPHDIMLKHPDCGNSLKTWERRLGLSTSRDKLERLTREVSFDNASY